MAIPLPWYGSFNWITYSKYEYIHCQCVPTSPLNWCQCIASRMSMHLTKKYFFARSIDQISMSHTPGVRDKRRVSEIDLSQPMHETAFWWCYNGSVTSQLTDWIKRPNYPSELITIYEHINTHNRESMPQRCRRSTMYKCVWYFCIYLYGFSLNVWHALFRITNNRHDVTITTRAIKRHFLIWMATIRQSMKRRCSCVLTLKYTFIWVYWWTRQRIHNTLIVIDRYLRLTGIKWFQTRRSLVWNRCIPHSSQVSIYHIKV